LSYPIRVSTAREGAQSAYESTLDVSWANVATMWHGRIRGLR